MRWIVGIIVGLSIVVAVNVAMIVIAVQSADPIDPTYASEAR